MRDLLKRQTAVVGDILTRVQNDVPETRDFSGLRLIVGQNCPVAGTSAQIERIGVLRMSPCPLGNSGRDVGPNRLGSRRYHGGGPTVTGSVLVRRRQRIQRPHGTPIPIGASFTNFEDAPLRSTCLGRLEAARGGPFVEKPSKPSRLAVALVTSSIGPPAVQTSLSVMSITSRRSLLA